MSQNGGQQACLFIKSQGKPPIGFAAFKKDHCHLPCSFG
jgi:hypothetical protein